jgi:hypothetical protein
MMPGCPFRHEQFAVYALCEHLLELDNGNTRSATVTVKTKMQHVAIEGNAKRGRILGALVIFLGPSGHKPTASATLGKDRLELMLRNPCILECIKFTPK